MKKHLIIFFLHAILILEFYPIFAQEIQKIPTDFFGGKWGGTISGRIKMGEDNLPFDLELIGNPGKNTASLKLNAGRTSMDETGDFILAPITVFDTQAPCAIYFKSNPPIFTLNFSQDFGKRIISDFNTLSAYQLAFVTGFKMEPKNEKLSFLSSREKTLFWKGGSVTGELHRIYVQKDTLGKTVQINEPIRTDQFTQREIVVLSVGEVVVNTNSKCKFEDGKSLEQIQGEFFLKVEKLKEEGHNFRCRSPQAVLSVRGTTFITKVEKDGTTILTVVDGEVEFSDIKKKATVVVRKNQRSVVNPGGLPAELEAIEKNQIPKWWK